MKDSKGMIACGNNNTSNCARTVDQSDKLMDVDSVLLVKSRLGYCPSIVTVVLNLQSSQIKQNGHKHVKHSQRTNLCLLHFGLKSVQLQL